MNMEMLPNSVEYPERIQFMKFKRQLIDIHEANHTVVIVDAASPACYRCHEMSHKAGDCPQNNDDQRGGSYGPCFQCGEESPHREWYVDIQDGEFT